MDGRALDEQRLRLLLDVGTSIVAELDSEAVLQRVLEAGRELTGARYAAVGILDQDRKGLERFLTAGVDEATRRAIGELPRGGGILGELIRHPEPLRLADISQHPRSYGFPPEHPPMTTFLGAPVLVRGEAWGNIYLTEKQGREFDEAEILRSGHAERLTEMSNRVRLGLGDLGEGARVAMLVPLMFHGRGVGILVALDRFDSSVPFSADDERLMRAFAGSAATALATAKTVEEEQLRMSIASADQERGRWARELHDETLQGLGALQVILTTALNQGSPDTVRKAAQQAVGQIETQIGELQGLITELRPAALDDIGLEPALSSLFDRTLEAHGVTVAGEVDLDSEARREGRLEPEIEGTVYRLVQEALSNTAKHAETDRVNVRVIERDGQISIEVRDDGRGFDPTEPRRGFGLLGMRERVELTGGSLEIASRPGAGTRVSGMLPARHLSTAAGAAVPYQADVA